MQFVAADWFKSDKREDHVASRSGCVLQKLEAQQVHMNMNLTQMVSLRYIPNPSFCCSIFGYIKAYGIALITCSWEKNCWSMGVQILHPVLCSPGKSVVNGNPDHAPGSSMNLDLKLSSCLYHMFIILSY